MYFILGEIAEYADSLVGLIFDNHYCINLPSCDGR
jgi:hypothetical protein